MSSCSIQMNAIWAIVETPSKIVFLIHDSFVLDIPAESRDNIPEIKNIFASNRFGKYRVGVRVGKDFGSMKEIEV